MVFHWPPPHHQLQDRVFTFPQILQDAALHNRIDILLEEHVPATDGTCEVITEISVFWHQLDGTFDMTEFVSHYYQTDKAN